MKNIISIIVAVVLILSQGLVYAKENVSEWAEPYFELMEELGVRTEQEQIGSYKEAINRLCFARIIHESYMKYTNERVNVSGLNPFGDTNADDAKALYVLGIAAGDENGNFKPDANITRQEAAKMLCNFYYVIRLYKLPENDETAKAYKDFNEIAKWARGYVGALGKANIMNGRGENMFCPNNSLTTQEAVVLIGRVIKYGEDSEPDEENNETDLEVIYGAPVLEEGETATVKWNELPDMDEYIVTLTEYRNTIHGEEMGKKGDLTYIVKDKEFTFNTKPVRRYIIKVTAGTKEKEFEIKTSQRNPWSENLSQIEAYGIPTTKEEADALMEEVTVDIWTLSKGEKVAGSATFMVHKAIAEKVKCIFKEIFEGKEQFPINSVSGYSWRGGKSEHNYGTALDINPNENYCVYTNGTIVGNYYKPGEDPYSLLPFGEVVEIFEKYGFNWGGDTWRGNRDFMHFSYCGT